MGNICAYSVNHPILYHSIRALSSYFATFGLNRGSSSEGHIALVARQIRTAITQGNFDYGHIFAVFPLGVMFTYREQFAIGW